MLNLTLVYKAVWWEMISESCKHECIDIACGEYSQKLKTKFGFRKWLCSLLHPRTEHHSRLDAILLQHINNSGLWWQLAQGGSERVVIIQSTIMGGVLSINNHAPLLSINNHGRGVRFIDVTKTNDSIWGMGKHTRRLKQKHWIDFYHYIMVVYRHCQHTFQYN